MGSNPNSSFMKNKPKTIMEINFGDYVTVEDLKSALMKHNLRNKDKITIEADNMGNALIIAKKVK